MTQGLSCQLYSARNFPPLDSQLATLAGLGYKNVEPFGGLYANIDALAGGLKAHGLKAPSGHFAFDMLENHTADAVSIAKKLGTHLLLAPHLIPALRPADAEGRKAFGHRLSKVRHKLANDDLTLGWHNHDFEMHALPDGTTPMQHILEADPELKWEADIGWIVRGKADPAAWLKTYAHQVAALHVKDIAAPADPAVEDGWADVGHGTIDWAKVMAAAPKGVLLVAEHDNPSDFARFARRSLATVQGW